MSAPKVSINTASHELDINFDSMSYDDLRQTKDALQKLTNSDGWSLLRGVVDSQVQLKNMALLQPLPNRDAILSCEHKKGQVAGAISVLDLPVELLTQIDNQLQESENE